MLSGEDSFALAAPGASDQSVLIARVEHMFASLRSLAEDVRVVESRQLSNDRRLTEFSSLLQGLQEEQYTQSKALAFGSQRGAHNATAGTVQKHMGHQDDWQTCLDKVSTRRVAELEKEWEARFREQKQSLMDLRADVAAITFEAPVHSGEGAGRDGGEVGVRLQALEQGQRAVAVSARRALQTAIVVHQQQQSHEIQISDQGVAADGVSMARPLAELEGLCIARFGEHEERIEKVLQLVDTLADKVLQVGSAVPDGRGSPRALINASASVPVPDLRLRDRIDRLEAHVYGLAAELQQRHSGEEVWHLQRAGQESVQAAIAELEGKVEQNLAELVQRLDALQEGRDSQRLQIRSVSHQMPEVVQKLDQLWAQCQENFPRIQEHDVNYSFLRTSFESHKQQMLELAELLERRSPGAGGPGGARSVGPTQAQASLHRRDEHLASLLEPTCFSNSSCETPQRPLRFSDLDGLGQDVAGVGRRMPNGPVR